MTGFSLYHINEIIDNQKSIKPEFAQALEKCFEGVRADFWLGLQKHYDEELLDNKPQKHA